MNTPNQAGVLQAHERFTHGGLAHLMKAGEEELGYGISGTQIAGEDGASHSFGNLGLRRCFPGSGVTRWLWHSVVSVGLGDRNRRIIDN